jgi:putative pyruvate formate lyase activating enzyme
MGRFEMTGDTFPAYQQLLASGRFDARIAALYGMLSSCSLCPRGCRVDRTDGGTGFCGGGLAPKVASYGPHFGEEGPLVGRNGSGAIFFAGCNLGCCFCQNCAKAAKFPSKALPVSCWISRIMVVTT